MMLKFQNISGRKLSSTIKVKTNLVEVQKNEMFGDSTDYLFVLRSFNTQEAACVGEL